jgi:response regulator RpfG family c-di-GMP phosphodiesterase
MSSAFSCLRKKNRQALFTREDLHYITTLTSKASLNLENHLLYESVYNNVFDTFKSLIASIQVRDQYTEEHCQRVTHWRCGSPWP